MSAELLHRAATVLREHAEGATPGPWEHVDYAGSIHPDATFMGCGSVVTMGEDVLGGDIAAPSGDLYPRGGYSPKEDMAFIALMNPEVGVAVAALLEDAADDLAQNDGVVDTSSKELAIAVARAILREAPDA
jgi:hypothetical protein